MVMAETQKSPESVRPTSACAPTDPPGLRRLRFPFFDLLVKEHWGETAANGPAWCRPAAAKTKPITRSSQGSLVFNPEIACPLPRASTWLADALN
jgi:hypothetical protein